MIIVGVDSDLNGGIACLDFSTREVHLAARMPVIDTEKRRLDNQELHAIFKRASLAGADSIVIEASITKPQMGKNGPTMTAGVDTTHQTFGGIRAAAEIVYGVPAVTVAWPSAWKKAMGLSKDKELSLDKAAELWPSHQALWRFKKNAGIAEAFLLAEWLYQKKMHLSAIHRLTNA